MQLQMMKNLKINYILVMIHFHTFSHHFPSSEVFFILHFFFLFSVSHFFSCCNLNGKPPDVCLMLEESKICII